MKQNQLIRFRLTVNAVSSCYFGIPYRWTHAELSKLMVIVVATILKSGKYSCVQRRQQSCLIQCTSIEPTLLQCYAASVPVLSAAGALPSKACWTGKPPMFVLGDYTILTFARELYVPYLSQYYTFKSIVCNLLKAIRVTMIAL